MFSKGPPRALKIEPFCMNFSEKKGGVFLYYAFTFSKFAGMYLFSLAQVCSRVSRHVSAFCAAGGNSLNPRALRLPHATAAGKCTFQRWKTVRKHSFKVSESSFWCINLELILNQHAVGRCLPISFAICWNRINVKFVICAGERFQVAASLKSPAGETYPIC